MSMGARLTRHRGIAWLAVFLVLALASMAVVWVRHRGAEARFVEFAMQESLDIPTAVAAGPDGNIWFTMDLAKAVGRVHDGRLERITTATGNVEPIGLGVGPDG